MRLALAIAILAVLVFPAHAATYGQVCGVENFDQDGAMTFLTIAFMFVSLVIALVYMYGKLRENAQASVWAKDEAYNLLISIFLFIGLLLFFTGSCAIAESYAGTDPFSASDSYLNQLLNANGMTVLRSLTHGSITNQFEATKYLYVGFTPFAGSGVAEYANTRARSAHKELVIDLYLPIVASLNAQKYLLQTIQWVAASVLLPFAFIMRMVPMTREFGNLFIALFFALYIVIPTMYVMSAHAFENVVKSPSCISCSVHNFYSFGIDEGDGVDGGARNTAVYQKAVFYKLGSTIPQAVFLPNLVLIVAITCVMAVSKALRAIAV